MIHFKRSEFKCKCGSCGRDAVDYELGNVLDVLREHFDVPVTITSGNRCEAHNKRIGGGTNSQHLLSKAADIKVKGVSPEVVYNYLDKKYPDKYGVGLYTGWVHIDVRTTRARW